MSPNRLTAAHENASILMSLVYTSCILNRLQYVKVHTPHSKNLMHCKIDMNLVILV